MSEPKRTRRMGPSQAKVLTVLKLKPRIGQSELRELAGVSRQAVAELMTKLEKGGYIARERSESDRRAVTVSLLPAGERVVAEMDCVPEVEEHIIEALKEKKPEPFVFCLPEKGNENGYAELIKDMRARTGLSQGLFAEYFDLTDRHIQAWERGDRSPGKAMVTMMYRLLVAEKDPRTEGFWSNIAE